MTVDVGSVCPEVGDRPYVRAVDIPPAQKPAADNRTAIVGEYFVGRNLCDRSPVARGEIGLEALDYSACRVFQAQRRHSELFELRERDVDIAFFVHLHPRLVGNGQNIMQGPLQFVPVFVGTFNDEAGDYAMGIERMHFCHPVARIGYQRPEVLDRPTEIPWRERNSSVESVYASPVIIGPGS